MGQKVSPNALRLGIVRDWENRWYAEKEEYVKWLNQDIKIRRNLLVLLKDAAVSKIDIERTKKEITLIIRTARPAIVLGAEGKNIEKIALTVKKTAKDKNLKVSVKVVEVRNPDADATLVARWIGEQITNRASFRTVQKLAIRRALKAGVKGIKTSVSGRLGGVEMARTEGYLEGSVPLSTLRANIDYALYEAKTTYGQIGVKVWINHGEIIGKFTRSETPELGKNPRNDRRDSRRPRREGNNPNYRNNARKTTPEGENQGGKR
ncbi:30S ribosomal protein S3 [Mesoplasma sp. JKS002658]|uniref:30S ribosomal protein S3 n=1 Tax=Mesoplasma whartonense TaxID=2878854 RepID=UPI002022AA42|nr:MULTISPECIES: 30S ribosomal protein S3 [unclassified Mesoplasma]MCL8211384.1 30S ribosomal protein S3 [Mesoplasma sp. JKS002664]MCL8212237.1 30S ribosomal protein S3 [Mesoplasma sp. JKS002662]MCL8212499.1 30S ribosomal protein S3 [Mesoplasma sp. JKS002661]MCL8213379.1 30S ribosomal protein S3 [Mesoplasma sp. JKS002660]MCL8214234.1 30S ribosomal protein S3 [Mesoplasma sp. JKS002658]